MALIDIFDLKNIQKFKLNQEEIDHIKYLLNNQPQIFNHIELNINLIINDDKLNLHDLPQIIFIIADVIQINHINVSRKVDIINLIQYIIDTIIDSGFLPLPSVELQIIKNIIDISMQLLKKNIYLIEEEIKNSWNLFCTH